VVIQSDDFNRSPIHTVVVCELTSVLRRANDPGNVLLVPGEGNLPEQSVVNVSRLVTLDKRILGNRIGVLDDERMREVLDGVRLVLEGEESGS
jgi:mRNA interferase MazF